MPMSHRHAHPTGLGGLLVSLMAVLALFLSGVSVRAQDASTSGGSEQFGLSLSAKPYIDPYRDRDRVNLVVFGDSLAKGLSEGLVHVFGNDAAVDVIDRTRGGSGFTRPDYFDWNKYLAGVLTELRVDVAVVLIGLNDNQSLRTSGARFRPGTDRWRQGYAQRVDQFIRQLKRHGAAVYWMGLPITRKRRLNRHMQTVNEILRERTRRQQAKFIETWDAFTNEDGRYAVFGPDATGRMRRLRAGNGLHFTGRGYVKMARLVHPEIAFDLAHAQQERNVELVGKPPIATDRVTQGAREADAELAETGARKFDLAITPAGELDDGAATPAVAEATSSGESTGEAGGPAGDGTRSVMLKVLLRGEKIEAKPGRADDFSWPRQP